MRYISQRILIVVLLLCCAVGCDEDTVDLQLPDGYADDIDVLMTLWREAYMSSDALQLEALMADDYVHELAQIDADRLGIGSTWTRDEELASARRMLGGKPGIRFDGSFQPPIQDFFVSFDGAPNGVKTEWERVETGELSGSYRRDYAVIGQLLDANQTIDFIAGIQTVHVRKVSISVEAGCCVGAYQVVRWRDAGLFIPPKHGTFGWGTIRARWRSR
jgi:hypothetical protein